MNETKRECSRREMLRLGAGASAGVLLAGRTGRAAEAPAGHLLAPQFSLSEIKSSTVNFHCGSVVRLSLHLMLTRLIDG